MAPVDTAVAISGPRRTLLHAAGVDARHRHPRRAGQLPTVGLAHPRVAAQLLHQHRGATAGTVACRHHVLSDLAETEASVEEQGRIAALLEEHFAGQFGIAQLCITLYVGVERAADATATTAAGDRDAVDVEEARMPIAEPAEIVAVVAGVGAEADQEPGQRTVALGDTEILGFGVEAAETARVERQDRRAGCIVQGKDGIQLVLTHVADDNRHSYPQSSKRCARTIFRR